MLLCSRILGYIMRRFLRSAMIVFSWFVVPYSRYTNIKVIRRKLPPIRSHLLEIPAVDLAKLIRTRKVSLPPFPFIHLLNMYMYICIWVNPLDLNRTHLKLLLAKFCKDNRQAESLSVFSLFNARAKASTTKAPESTRLPHLLDTLWQS